MRDRYQGGRFESKHERDAIPLWGLTPRVRVLQLQQPKVEFIGSDGKPHQYRADIHVAFDLMHLPPLAVECKYQAQIDAEEELRDKLGRLPFACGAAKKRFLLQTDTDTYALGFESRKHIWSYHNEPASPFEDEVVDCVRKKEVLSVDSVLTALRLRSDARLELLPYIWRAVARGRLFVDYRETANRTMLLNARPLAAKIVNGLLPDEYASAIDEANQRGIASAEAVG